MATGSGKTKVLSLAITWSYFHKIYEDNSDLSTNFLVVAPNIIVLERLLTDLGRDLKSLQLIQLFLTMDTKIKIGKRF